jgi:hypothetical protein
VSRFRRVKLDTPEWGEVKIMVAIPRDGNPWGVLAPLQDTAWGEQISVVSGEVLSHALHGWVVPLMKVIGIDPGRRACYIPNDENECALIRECLGARSYCFAASNITPSCYEPIGADPIAKDVMLAWQDGWYVLVVEGPEFSF